MTNPEPGARRLRAALCRRTLALLLAAPLLAATTTHKGYELRYRLEPGQTWSAVHTVVSETTVAGATSSHTGTARFRYEVLPGSEPGRLQLAARMLSQETEAGASPFDFSSIHFVAETDARGVTRGRTFLLDDDVLPPKLPGVEDDPAQFRQMLRSLASAWIGSVYWMPVLPERALSVGESFVQDDSGDVGGTDPGVRMEMRKQTTYRLRKVTGPLAEFSVAVRSTVDAATARSGIVSKLQAEGEALFDLDAGMWLRQQIRSQEEASVHGAKPGSDRASARTTTTIEMQPVASPPA